MAAVDVILLVIECLGSAAFAASGAIVAIRKKADVFGILVLSVVTTLGGGLIRDLILGVTPPHLFWDASYAVSLAVAVGVSVVCMLLAIFSRTANYLMKHENGLLISIVDAVGLGIFCVSGINSALSVDPQYAENWFLLTFVGCISGVGGGLLRDLFVCEIPMIFRKNVYALPTILGALLYILLYQYVLPQLLSMFIAICFIIGMRILAAVFHWNLPVLYHKTGM